MVAVGIAVRAAERPATQARLSQLEFVHLTADLTSWVWEVESDQVQWFGDPEALLGLAPGSFSGRFSEYLGRLHPEDVAGAKSTFVHCLKGVRPRYRSEERVVLPDGGIRWLETFGQAQYSGDGRALRLAGVVRDITVRREAEERIRQLNATLEERVLERTRELENFSLAVSHDLRSPARAITVLAGLLLREAGGLQEEGRQHVERIAGIARRMGDMTDGLLELSSAGRRKVAPGAVGMRELALELLEDLRLACSYNGELVVEDLPPAWADARLVSQVLQNLVGNAMKFTRHAVAPLIALTAQALPGGLIEYCVRDNGCGFEGRHAARLFGAFQRLHSQAQYEGVGVGLATVRRIVERHGGTTRAEGEPGCGAAFYFTLPAARA